MDSKNVISKLMKEKNITTIALAERLGYKYPSGITERLRGKHGIRDDVLVKFLEAMDCELVIRDKNTRQEWIIGEEEVEPPKVDLDSLLSEE